MINKKKNKKKKCKFCRGNGTVAFIYACDSVWIPDLSIDTSKAINTGDLEERECICVRKNV